MMIPLMEFCNKNDLKNSSVRQLIKNRHIEPRFYEERPALHITKYFIDEGCADYIRELIKAGKRSGARARVRKYYNK